MRSNVMKSLMVVGGLLAGQTAMAATWDIDASHARVGFLVKHMAVTEGVDSS